MGLLKFLPWRPQGSTNLPVIIDDDENLPEDDPDIDHKSPQENLQCDFQRSNIQPHWYRIRTSLLTKAIHAHDEKFAWTDTITTSLDRRKSNASSLELTSDSGQTSPARSEYGAVYGAQNPPSVNDRLPAGLDTSTIHDKCVETSSTQPRKRSITFMCSPSVSNISRSRSGSDPQPRHTADHQSILVANSNNPGSLPRKSTIKFACAGPQVKAKQGIDTVSSPHKSITETCATPRSPSPLACQSVARETASIERSLGSSEATRSHVFARESIDEDDWLRRDVEIPMSKLTINDTLRKENEIRRLASEAEEEDRADEDTQIDGDISEDEMELNDENDDEEELSTNDHVPDDGNETDNEAGFANSDESDADEYDFWVPGHQLLIPEGLNHRVSANHRTASISSIDSIHNLCGNKTRRNRKPLKKVRPGTPDLPDSTDFVCGTLDEDRPLEEAYLSSKEARKMCRHTLTPQDIDPSFPTSDVENEDSDDCTNNLIISGPIRRFDESINELDDVNHRGRNYVVLNRNPLRPHSLRRLYSPPPIRRLHSPPPNSKQRLRSPPPRKFFGNSPKYTRSLARTRLCDQRRSLTLNSRPILSPGQSMGLTKLSSNALEPNNSCFTDDSYDNDDDSNIQGALATENNLRIKGGKSRGHVRGAIDIVKGLEQRRERRKEKFNQNQKNRKIKGAAERKPPPGQGAERMREIALFTNIKTGTHKPYILSA